MPCIFSLYAYCSDVLELWFWRETFENTYLSSMNPIKLSSWIKAALHQSYIKNRFCFRLLFHSENCFLRFSLRKIHLISILALLQLLLFFFPFKQQQKNINVTFLSGWFWHGIFLLKTIFYHPFVTVVLF